MKNYIVLLIAALLTACGDSEDLPQQQIQPQQQYQEQYQQPFQQPTAAPVIINQQPPAPMVQHDDDTMSDMLVGGLVGAAAANAMNGGNRQYASQPQVTNTHTIRERVVYRSNPKPVKKWNYRPTQVKPSSYTSSRNYSRSRR